jgi:hypothetical protein
METYTSKDIDRYRKFAAPIIAAKKTELRNEVHRLNMIDPEMEEYQWLYKRGLRPIGGGAPSLMTVLATLPGPATANTYTTAQTILSSSTTNQTSVGPFSVDYFKTTGATWEQEAMGIISVAAATTPTFAMGSYYGTAIAAATVLCITVAQTCISGMANVNWYYNAFGHTRTITATTATMLVTGVLIGQLATAAAGNNTIYAVNATPPTAVTTDLSTSVYIDLKGTWGTSSASNTTTVNFYNLKSLYA